MSRSVSVRLLLACALMAVTFTGCSRDPNVRKQKYFDSGEKYFAAGKYREAAIQYSNAIQIDSRFAQAHSQLAQAYLKLGDTNRAFQELNRSEVFFAAIEIFLLADVGITGAACKRHGHQSTSQQQTDRNGATHIGFSNCGYREHTSTLIRTQPP